MENKEEIWKDIVGYEGLYQASNLGKIKSIRFGKEHILKPALSGKTYKYQKVGLWSYDKKVKQLSVHKIIVLTFPEICGIWYKGCEIDHIDTDRTNNKAVNLRVCSPKENHNNPLTRKHLSEGMKSKTKEYFIEKNAYKKKKVVCIETGQIFESIYEAAEKTGAVNECITRVCKNKQKTAGGLHFRYV